MKKTVCDWQDDKGKLCGDDAPLEVSINFEGDSYRADLCKQHGQFLVNAGEKVTSRPQVTRLPTATGRKPQEQLVDKIDYVDLRNWLEGQGDLPAGSRGRIKQELQQKWLDAGSPRPV